MARFVLREAIDAAKIISVHGHGAAHWMLVLSDGRSAVVHHDWVAEHQPVTVGDWYLFLEDGGGGFAVPDRTFNRLFSLPIAKPKVA